VCSTVSAHKQKVGPKQKTREVKTVELLDQAVGSRSEKTIKGIMHSISSELLQYSVALKLLAENLYLYFSPVNDMAP